MALIHLLMDLQSQNHVAHNFNMLIPVGRTPQFHHLALLAAIPKLKLHLYFMGIYYLLPLQFLPFLWYEIVFLPLGSYEKSYLTDKMTLKHFIFFSSSFSIYFLLLHCVQWSTEISIYHIHDPKLLADSNKHQFSRRMDKNKFLIIFAYNQSM